MPLISYGSAACARERAWTGRGGGDCVWPHCWSWGCINSQRVTRSSVIFNCTVVLAQDGGSHTVKSAVLLYYDETSEIKIHGFGSFCLFLPGWMFVCVEDECGCTIAEKKKEEECSENNNEIHKIKHASGCRTENVFYQLWNFLLYW